jgi:hypothetical protein
MHIQNPSAYSTAVVIPPGRYKAGADRQDESGPAAPVSLGRESDYRPAPNSRNLEAVQRPAAVDYERIDAHAEQRKLSELNPKLDRRTQAAIRAYEALQYQGETEQRESVSRLLGIDLYV